MGTRFNLDAAIVKAAATGNWRTIFAQLPFNMDTAMRKAPKHAPHPIYGGRDGFRLQRDWEETGASFSNSSFSHHDGLSKSMVDGFETIMHLGNMNFAEALELVWSIVGCNQALSEEDKRKFIETAEEQRRLSEEKRAEETKKITEWGMKIVDSSVVDLESLNRYRAGRGLKAQERTSDNIRFISKLNYRDNKTLLGSFPAIISLFRDIEGNITGFERVYLNRSLNAKLDLGDPELKARKQISFGVLAGSAIRITEADREFLAVGEGYETMSAVMELIGSYCPTWAASSRALLQSMEIPSHVKRVGIFLDNDEGGDGLVSAKVLRDRLIKQGVEVTLFKPPILGDWLDVLNKGIKFQFKGCILNV